MNRVLSETAKELKAREKNQGPEKRTFIILLLLTCVGLVVGAVTLWLVPYVGFSNIHPKLPIVMAVLFALIVMFLIGGGLTLVFTIIRGKNLFFNRRIRGVVIRFLFPLLVLVGRCIGINKDQVRRSFITINNQLVLAEARRVPPAKLLILLPQCIQNHECAVRITGNVENCKACGKCKIKNLVELSKKYHVSIAVATGGTLARKIVVDKMPEMIIGVACERDLTSGIQDAYPIPVYGILNHRPNGPCYDTDVDLDLVESGMAAFLKYER
ncbi:MAG: DUF116 domain-containing protein [Desulfobacterales bacterium]|nr:DUF116 domain-containing protein [Desulfobacterales bacterium]